MQPLVRALSARVARFAVTFLLVTFAVAALLQLTPGSPALAIAGDSATPAVIAAINRQYRFNEPVFTRYGDWLGGALHGNFGVSYQSQQPVRTMISQRLPVTVELVLLAMVLALVIAVPVAMASAARPGSLLDRASAAVSSAVVSIPPFLVAVTLLYLLAVKVHILPLLGWAPISAGLWENLRHAALPVIALALANSVILMRVLRAELIDTLQQDFITLARSKGLSTRKIMWRHALRPSLAPLVTMWAVVLASLLGSTVIVESIFSLPGLGTLLLDSVTTKDLVTVQGIVALFTVVVLFVNLLVDVVYGIIDPRIRGVRTHE